MVHFVWDVFVIDIIQHISSGRSWASYNSVSWCGSFYARLLSCAECCSCLYILAGFYCSCLRFEFLTRFPLRQKFTFFDNNFQQNLNAVLFLFYKLFDKTELGCILCQYWCALCLLLAFWNEACSSCLFVKLVWHVYSWLFVLHLPLNVCGWRKCFFQLHCWIYGFAS